VAYNAMSGGSVGPGGSGKTQTHRSVMGEPFDGSTDRISTVGAVKVVLELCRTKTHTIDLQRAETTSLLERTVCMAAKKAVAQPASIAKLVATNASRAEVQACELCRLPRPSTLFIGQNTGGHAARRRERETVACHICQQAELKA